MMNTLNQVQLNNQLKKSLHRIAIVCILLILINLFLAISLFKQDHQTILIPTRVNKSFMVTDEYVSEEYLELITRDLINLILNLTTENYEYVEASILKIVHPSFYGVLKQQLYELAREIKENNVSTNFIMNEINLDKQKLQAFVSGHLETHIGLKIVSRELKKYKIIYDYSHSKLTLKEFYEVKDEQ